LLKTTNPNSRFIAIQKMYITVKLISIEFDNYLVLI